MSHTDNRRDRTLPITAEVGSEGGSYADPARRAPAFDDDIHRSSRGGARSAPNDATQLSSDEGPARHAEGGMLRYPTEPPSPPSATEGWRVGGMNWRTAVIGAAAGAAIAYGIVRLGTHRNRNDRDPGGFGSGVTDE